MYPVLQSTHENFGTVKQAQANNSYQPGNKPSVITPKPRTQEQDSKKRSTYQLYRTSPALMERRMPPLQYFPYNDMQYVTLDVVW